MSPWGRELRALVRFAAPATAIQLAMMGMGVADVVMVGRASAANLAALSIGNFFAFGMMGFGLGTLMALDPIVSQAVGARDEVGVARGLQRGLVLALVLSMPIVLLMMLARPVMVLMQLSDGEEVIPLATAYTWVSMLSVPAFLGFVAVRHTLQAMHLLRHLLLVALIANVANVALNWALVWGNAGFPALGAEGCAWATVVCRWLMFLGLVAVAWRHLGPYLRPWRRDALAALPLLRMLRLGLPVGLQVGAEISAFGFVALVLGKLGAETVAGHQVALNLASLAFMVPLGLSMGAAVRVGNAIGGGRPAEARLAAIVAQVAGCAFMACAGTLFLAVPEALARLYTGEAAVVAVAATLLPIAALFQVFDGLQVVCSGILRGVGDTVFPLAIYLVGFWLVAIPLGLTLCFTFEGGATGMWWGLVAGLAAVSIAAALRVRVRLARALERVRIDDEHAAASF
jgi:MATE family multidrug resistance protein